MNDKPQLYKFVPLLVASLSAIKRLLKIGHRHAVAIILEEDKVLLMKRSITDPWKPCHWALPGGGVDPGETLKEGLIREIKEETYLDVNPNDLQFLKFKENGKLAVFVLNNKHKGKVDLDKASHGYEHESHHWATKKELPYMELVPDLLETLVEAMG